MRWLMPRLHRFIVANPNIDVYVDTCARLFLGMRASDARAIAPSAGAEEAEVTLMYGATDVPGLMTERLLDVAVTPLCSPSLLQLRPTLTSAQQLAFFPLLHCDRDAIYGDQSLWNIWLNAAGANNIRTDHSPRFTQAALAIEAAVDGLGMVVCNPVLAMAELESGKLVAPFDLLVSLSSGYQIVSSETSRRRSAVAAFIAWLHAEAEDTRAKTQSGWPACGQK
jgi:LysR family glycine cleavage system transcriptional activator